MKYIRTKDGRIIKYFPPFFPTCDNRIGYPSSKGLIFEEEILKQANTIEDLCDKFVLLYNDKGKLFSDIFDERFKEYIHGTKTFTNNFKAVYGFIWVELPNGAPRLEPVCKLNEQGELELL